MGTFIAFFDIRLHTAILFHHRLLLWHAFFPKVSMWTEIFLKNPNFKKYLCKCGPEFSVSGLMIPIGEPTGRETFV